MGFRRVHRPCRPKLDSLLKHSSAAYGGVTNRQWVQVRSVTRVQLVKPVRTCRPFLLVLLMLFASTSACLSPSVSNIDKESDAELMENLERYHFSIDENRIFDLRPVETLDESLHNKIREEFADTRIGLYSSSGLEMIAGIPDWAVQPRMDLQLVIVDSDIALEVSRASLSDIQGLVVREFISPSGFILQGSQLALEQAKLDDTISSYHSVPLAMIIDDSVLFNESLDKVEVRIESWRLDVEERIDSQFVLTDIAGRSLQGDIAQAAEHLSDAWFHSEGRWQGILAVDELPALVSDPAVAWIREPPVFGIFNDQSRSHMKSSTMSTYFTTDLDGSGEIVGVADTGIDHDHGDFGTRIVQKVDIVGDGSTADTDSGHGTHVACTVLGDGSRGGYTGVVPEAELYFQAMEHDASGNMYSASINSLMTAAYDAGARTHSNSWGSRSSSDYGRYTTDAEDVDDMANYYDRYYSNREGLTILYANGNDGPQSGTVGAPATAKNSISVGMHQARYSGAPDSIMSGSSRGPTDDGRIKPDILAPGGYVRSCRAQEAQDVSGNTWSSQWYLEYTGTSMATPNAAGAAAMVREYLTEISQRQQPQGALVKALLILGAEDTGTRDIPNNDEGWGRINLRNTLAPNAGRGIWVDDRSVLSSTGSVKSYTFDVSSANVAFKTSLVWSDERGSRFNNGAQLVNDLDLEVIAPDGTTYRGNDFFNGRSTTGGDWDDLNNVEVVLVDQAAAGIWTVKVKDGGHGGSRSQPFALAVSGVGVNDLRPDASPVPSSIQSNIAIPQIGDEVTIFAQVQNFGNVKVDNLEVAAYADSNLLDTYQIDLGPGESQSLSWPWIPDQDGERTIVVEVDPNDLIEEIEENNNRLTTIIEVTAPGVKVSSSQPTVVVSEADQSVASWQVELTNTALLETNASLNSDGTVYRQADGALFSDWFVSSSGSNYTLDGKESATINISLIHPSPPDPGTYILPLTGIDIDNAISYPFDLILEVLEVPELSFSMSTSSVLVSPESPTTFEIEVHNEGNSAQGWNLYLQSPSGWQSGFDDLGSRPGAPSGSTGAIPQTSSRVIPVTVHPPQVMVAAGSQIQLNILAISQINSSRTWEIDVDLVVASLENASVELESSFGVLRPDSTLNLQFTVFNTGNVDLSLYPTADLPGGWSITSAMQTMEVEVGDSRNWLVSLEGNGFAVGGDFNLHLTSSNTRFSWLGTLDVKALAEPSLQFAYIEIGGEEWDHPLGPGSHPVATPLNFTWYVINEGDGEWAPSASISADSGIIADCQQIDVIPADGEGSVSCTVVLPSGQEPGSQPKITLTLDADGISRENIVSLYVEEIRAVSWSDIKVPVLSVGEATNVEVRIRNDGNVDISRRVLITDQVAGWTVNIDGSSLVQMEPGQEQTIRISINANQAGEGSISLGLSEGDSVQGSEHSVPLLAEGQAISEQTKGGTSTLVWFSLGIMIVGVIGILLVLIQRKPGGSKSANRNFAGRTPMAAPPATAFAQNPGAVQQAAGVQCWACMKSITEDKCLACPGCGARYHLNEHGCGTASLQQCRSCQAEVSSFIIT